ncbi:MAG: hypothetical protein E4H41_09465, partial [Gemmatimonadales bacterium]
MIRSPSSRSRSCCSRSPSSRAGCRLVARRRWIRSRRSAVSSPMSSQSIRLAVRSLARARGFTVVALATLALGIGASTAMFTVVRAVLLRELPFDRPAELVQVGHEHAERGPVFGAFSPQDFDDVRASTGKFSSLSAYFYMPGLGLRNLTGLGAPLSVSAVMADGQLFGTLGVSAVQGRTFDATDDVLGANQVVVLSDG